MRSSSTSACEPNETRAALTTDRSSPIWASSRTKPSSSTSIRVTRPVYRPASRPQARAHDPVRRPLRVAVGGLAGHPDALEAGGRRRQRQRHGRAARGVGLDRAERDPGLRILRHPHLVGRIRRRRLDVAQLDAQRGRAVQRAVRDGALHARPGIGGDHRALLIAWNAPDDPRSMNATTASAAAAAARPMVATRHVRDAVQASAAARPRAAEATGPAISRMRASSAAEGSGSGPLARTRPST